MREHTSREPLPKALSLRDLASAREPEINSLVSALRDPESEPKYGEAAAKDPLRRRTTAHMSYQHKRRRPNVQKERRRQKMVEAQQGNHEADSSAFENRAMLRQRGRLLASKTGAAPGGGERWLESHFWHAKRMVMLPRWGLKLAEHKHGKGKVSKSLLDYLKTGTVMHDASYWCPLHVKGAADKLWRLLTGMMEPRLVDLLKNDKLFLAGRREATAVLHESGSYPRQPIGPVSLMLSPPPTGSKENATWHLWIWVHPAALDEADAAMADAGKVLGIIVTPKKGVLGRFELRGMGSDSLLARVLAMPKSLRKGQDTAVDADVACWHTCIASDNPQAAFDKLSEGRALHLITRDPRLAKPLPEAGDIGQPSAAAKGSMPPVLQLASQGAELPQALSANQAGGIRHRARMEGLYLAPMDQDQPDKPPATMDGPLCPITAIRRDNKPNNPTSWTLIFPASWSRTLWTALDFAGANAAGQKEWHLVAEHCGQAFFPHDFPDTRSAGDLDMILTAEDAAERMRRPKGRYPDSAHVDWAATYSGEACAPLPSAIVLRRQRAELEDELMPSFLKEAMQERPATTGNQQAAFDALGLMGPEDTCKESEAMDFVVEDGDLNEIEGPLLQPGCYVARSLPVLQAAMPSLIQQQQRRSQAALRWKWQPKLQPSMADSSNMAVDSNGEARQASVSDAELLPWDEQCYVRVWLQFRFGPGTAKTSAAVFASINEQPATAEEADKDRQPPSMQASREKRIKGVNTSDSDPIGYVTSGQVKGLSTRRGPIAVCNARALLAVRGRDSQSGGRRQKGTAVRVLVQNPRSTVAHKAEAFIVLETPEGDQSCV